MKKYLFLIATLLATQPAVANERLCQMFGQTAVVIMQHRQAGTPQQQLLRTLLYNSPVLSPRLSGPTLELITEAYSRPRYKSQQNRSQAISVFRDQTIILCRENF